MAAWMFAWSKPVPWSTVIVVAEAGYARPNRNANTHRVSRILAPMAAKLISVLIKRFDSVSEIPGLIPTTIVALVLFFAWLAHVVGAPELLGGFAAGLALSRRFFLPFGVALRTDPVFAHKIEGQMRPVIQLFTPIFFVMVGLSLNLREIDWSSPFIWSFSLLFFFIAVSAKLKQVISWLFILGTVLHSGVLYLMVVFQFYAVAPIAPAGPIMLLAALLLAGVAAAMGFKGELVKD